MHMGFVKLKKWPKSVHGCQRYTPKCKAVAFCAWKSALHLRGGRLPSGSYEEDKSGTRRVIYFYIFYVSFVLYMTEERDSDTLYKNFSRLIAKMSVLTVVWAL
jgi:hypothetical protein